MSITGKAVQGPVVTTSSTSKEGPAHVTPQPAETRHPVSGGRVNRGPPTGPTSVSRLEA